VTAAACAAACNEVEQVVSRVIRELRLAAERVPETRIGQLVIDDGLAGGPGQSQVGHRGHARTGARESAEKPAAAALAAASTGHWQHGVELVVGVHLARGCTRPDWFKARRQRHEDESRSHARECVIAVAVGAALCHDAARGVSQADRPVSEAQIVLVVHAIAVEVAEHAARH
jgi:hypothetical protein